MRCNRIPSSIVSLLLLGVCGARLHAQTADLPAAQRADIAGLRKQGPFLHPGVLHTQADFERMKAKVAARQEPWTASWERLQKSPHGLAWRARPFEEIIRGIPGNNYTPTQKDVATIYQCALRYKISGDTAQADKAVEILNAWSGKLKHVGGNSNFALAGGIIGYEFAAAGEMVRDYPNWKRDDFAAFQEMMRTVFYTANHAFLVKRNGTCGTHYRLNWDTCNMASMLAIGVLCDDPDIFNEALAYFTDGVGNGCIERAIWYVFPNGMGQPEEMGRDQAHNLTGLNWLALFCEIAWNQGIDVYGYDNNRFLRGIEYVAKYNLGYDDVPFVPHRTCDMKYTEACISAAGRGNFLPLSTQVYNHYVNRRGIAAPYTKEAMEKMEPNGGPSDYGTHPSLYDWLGYSTLTYMLDPIAQGAAPSGPQAQWSGNEITLAWWGSAYAEGYAVKRSTTSGGPYATVGQTGPKDTTFTDKQVKDGERYYYVISARGSKAQSLDSKECAVSQSLVARYEFKGDARDSVGGHDGVASGAPRYAPGHGSGHAIEFDGEHDYVRLPADVANYSDITIATWVEWGGGKDWQRIFDFGGDASNCLFLTPHSGERNLRFNITTTRDNEATGRLTAPPLPPGRWVHVAITLGGNVGTLYIDGHPVNTAPITTHPLFTQNRCYLGKSQYDPDALFKGRLADLRIYNYALPAAQVMKLANAKD